MDEKIEKKREPVREVVESAPKKRTTRAQRKERVRLERSGALKMVAHLVDTQLDKEMNVRMPFDEDVFGHESYTFVSWHDYEAVFTLSDIGGCVITSYIM